jgi:hypothetical protein
MDEKKCFECGEVRPIVDFRKDSRRKGGRTNVCKPCHAKRELDRRGGPKKQWWQDPVKLKAHLKELGEQHRRRAGKK